MFLVSSETIEVRFSFLCGLNFWPFMLSISGLNSGPTNREHLS